MEVAATVEEFGVVWRGGGVEGEGWRSGARELLASGTRLTGNNGVFGLDSGDCSVGPRHLDCVRVFETSVALHVFHFVLFEQSFDTLGQTCVGHAMI